MRMLSDRMHGRLLGLVLAVNVGWTTGDQAKGQPSLQNADSPASVAFPGPTPMSYDSGTQCDSNTDGDQGLFGTGLLRGPFGGHYLRGRGAVNHLGGPGYPTACGPAGCGIHGPMGCPNCGLASCGALGCGTLGCCEDGFLGSGPIGRWLYESGACMGGPCGPIGLGYGGGGMLGGLCSHCGGVGCLACGSAGLGLAGDGALFSGRLISKLLGPLAPYSEGAGSQRWFDVYAGTIALARRTRVGPVTTNIQIPDTVPAFETTDIISTLGVGLQNPVLRTTDLDLDKIRFGLEIVGAIQTGPGANVEVRYFGLNNWRDVQSARSNSPDLYSIFSNYGLDPAGGFDDTDRSFIHTIRLESKLDNGEVNYRRRWMGYNPAFQGSWMGGIRYFELDENFGFEAVGSFDNTFTFDQLRFFNMDTRTRNHLVGFQIGADLWVNVIPGVAVGNDFRFGIFNNNSKVDTLVVANSVPGAREILRKEAAAFLIEYSAQVVYRLTYSWSLRGAYNLMYLDEVALATQNFNPRDMATAIDNDVFGPNRFPFINADGHVFYQGFSIGAEYLW